MLEFLPKRIKDGLSHINLQFVYELRLRVDNPITINYKGQYRYLGEYGFTELAEKALYCDREEINECVFYAGNRSVYSVEEQIKRGYITAEKGERIGLAGEYVFDKGQPLTIRNLSSLCIRIPHEIRGCGNAIYKRCMSDRIPNLLICSSPGIGKTTILRDLSRIISEKTGKNLLICDERGEISAMNAGATCDILKYADKTTAFEAGIRAMRPDIIVTDELFPRDIKAIEHAIYAGVKVLASAHFTNAEQARHIFNNLFDFYAVLDEKEIGKIKNIYNKEGGVVN